MEESAGEQKNGDEINDKEKEEGSGEMMDSENKEDGSSMPESDEGSVMDSDEDNADQNTGDQELSIDDTWKTYTSRSEDWQFNWPTKGLYAPMWEVTFVGEDDLTDGCLGSEAAEKLTLSGVEFCHTHKLNGSESTDHFVTKHGDLNIVLTFTKDTEAYAGFKMDDYSKQLKLIVSTFKYLN